jgi:putative hydrolase of the HAD superfamily
MWTRALPGTSRSLIRCRCQSVECGALFGLHKNAFLSIFRLEPSSLCNFAPLMPLRAVLFDLDDTVIVDEAVSREAFEAVARYARDKHGAEEARFARDAAEQARVLWAAGPCSGFCRYLGISAFECLWGRFEGDGEFADLRKWAFGFREQVFDHALRQQMIESVEGSRDLAEAFARERRLLQRLMPDALEILTRLSGRYTLGLLTNGAPDLQREKIAASGTESLFSQIVISGVYGIGKPHPEIFLHLTDRLGVSPAEAAMVGNSLERDIQGARDSGIISIWLKVPGSEEHSPVEPNFTIGGLRELPSLLERIGA